MASEVDVMVPLGRGDSIVVDGAMYRVRDIDTSDDEDVLQLDVGGLTDALWTRREFREHVSDADVVAVFSQ